MINNERLVRACRRQEVDRAPVWLLGQAGPYLPAHQDLCARRGVLATLKTSAEAVELALQPYEALGVDAVALFAPGLLFATALGLPLTEDDKQQLRLVEPLRHEAQVAALTIADPGDALPFVLETIGQLRHFVRHDVPVIGSAAAPFTLAAYLTAGQEAADCLAVKQMLYGDPALLHSLLDKLANATVLYLNAQIEAGAQVVFLDDRLAGELSLADYEEFALPYTQTVLAHLHRGPKGLSVPAMLSVNNAGVLLEKLAETDANVLSLDWRLNLTDARRRLDAAGFSHVALQGNLDPAALLGTPDSIQTAAEELLRDIEPIGHVLNLGGAVLRQTPVENALAFVEAAKSGVKDVA